MRFWFGAALLATFWGSAMAIEEPDYTVVREYGAFELRRYEPYLVAEVDVDRDFSEAGNVAFRILFRYISGANRASASIPMAAPVIQQSAGSGEKIPMTAPVVQTPAGFDASGRHVVGFVMPRSFTLETLPRPDDPRIRIRQVPARLVAARRYSGSWSEDRYRENEAALLEAIAKQGFTAAEPPTFARYNSPFALWFLRRNEVLVPIGPAP